MLEGIAIAAVALAAAYRGVTLLRKRPASEGVVPLPVPPLDGAARTKLVEDHRAGLLTVVAVGSTLDYYVEFNASGRADVEKQAAGYRYVLVVMDGRLRVTDGSTALQIGPPAADSDRDCAVEAPVAWRVVPAGALVVGER